MKEFDWIARYLAPLAGPAGLGLRDDAACWHPPAGQSLVMTKDAMVAGVHFLPDDPANRIAQKLLRVNLSDLAAKGAEPQGYLLSLSLPHVTEEAWVKQFCDGLAKDQHAFDIQLWGGDTTATPGPLTLSLTAMGTVAEGAMIPRNGAKVGDDIYITGTLGDAALWLAEHQGRVEAMPELHALQSRYQLPTPRLEVGRRLHNIAHAALDVSDGLLADAEHLAASSKVKLQLQCAAIPLSAPAALAVKQQPDASWPIILSGGDDYELLFTAAPAQKATIQKLAEETAIPITPIGKVMEGEAVEIIDEEGNALQLAQKGWQHF